LESGDKKEEKNGKRKKRSELKTSWLHKNNSGHKSHDSYDYTQRNPLYSGAEKTMTFELLHFSKHYHPTVALFANKLINVSSKNSPSLTRIQVILNLNILG
jgi:ribosome biogenesis protein MAK21